MKMLRLPNGDAVRLDTIIAIRLRKNAGPCNYTIQNGVIVEYGVGQYSIIDCTSYDEEKKVSEKLLAKMEEEMEG